MIEREDPTDRTNDNGNTSEAGEAADQGLARLEALPREQRFERFFRCCGSRRWARAMAARGPFSDRRALFETASRIWRGLDREDWLEAFSHHPRIGDLERLRERFGESAQFSEREQAGVREADEQTLRELARLNRAYEERFGWIFLISASGKSAREMLEQLRARLENDPQTELSIAAGEQEKITRIRLEKLLES